MRCNFAACDHRAPAHPYARSPANESAFARRRKRPPAPARKVTLGEYDARSKRRFFVRPSTPSSSRSIRTSSRIRIERDEFRPGARIRPHAGITACAKPEFGARTIVTDDTPRAQRSSTVGRHCRRRRFLGVRLGERRLDRRFDERTRIIRQRRRSARALIASPARTRVHSRTMRTDREHHEPNCTHATLSTITTCCGAS